MRVCLHRQWTATSCSEGLHVDATTQSCARCGRAFVPRFRFQTEVQGETVSYFCSQTCREPALTGSAVACVSCSKAFAPTMAMHLIEDGAGRRYVCSEACRAQALPRPVEAVPAAKARAIAVLNQKGGTGKTTTALSLAAG